MKTKKLEFWEKFNPLVYVMDNYAKIHDEDKRIIEILVYFYESLSPLKQSLEIGGGPNLYPLMLALPYVENIDVIDFSSRNIDYLNRQLNKPETNWYLFWDLLKKLSLRYRDMDLIANLRQKIKVSQGSIYDLQENKYDLASMFFCADSITDKIEEFKLTCNKFIKSVKPNGFLVAAFMEKSKGYTIDGIRFPAVSVDSGLLKRTFQSETTELKIYRIPKAANALRPGYTGILLLTAKRF